MAATNNATSCHVFIFAVIRGGNEQRDVLSHPL
jgi:hypothetical protein